MNDENIEFDINLLYCIKCDILIKENDDITIIPIYKYKDGEFLFYKNNWCHIKCL